MTELLATHRVKEAEMTSQEVMDRPHAQELSRLPPILAEVESIVPPLWPLKDYVAVNPFLGMSHETFLCTRQMMCDVRDCDLLLPLDYFRELFEQGAISRHNVEDALRQCVEEYPDLYADFHLSEAFTLLEGATAPTGRQERPYRTVAEAVDHHQGSGWNSHIITDITRHCSRHFDEGQASWSSPWKHLSLYAAWREAAQLSVRMDMLGMPGFRTLVCELPDSPIEAIAELLDELEVPSQHWRSFLLCEIFSVAGWASYTKYRVREAEFESRRDEDLLGLLAMRLAYDVALAHAHQEDSLSPDKLYPHGDDLSVAPHVKLLAPPVEVLASYMLQVAAEIAYRRKLCQSLVPRAAAERKASRKSAQLIFCIDVRSEVLRRHLESVDETIETFGFAGFFGMALEYVPLGESAGAAHCPVLLRPGFRVPESLLGSDEATQAKVVSRRQAKRRGRKLWKSFRTSAISCFSFVESLGLPYVLTLFTDSFRVPRPVADAQRDGLPLGESVRLGPNIHAHGGDALSSEEKIDLAEGMLRNLGLTEDFARIVAVCGHAADVVNNPYKSGLDCGACGGHSGEPNARVAAALLNDGKVRAGLASRGIAVPDDTWFVPGVHNTTTDEIMFHDTADMPGTHLAEFEQLQFWIAEAGERSRVERARRLGNAPAADIYRRSRDWSEVRPEWGLAGNAALVVAPRSRTEGLDLAGRAFMHSYDYRQDPEFKVLELIMTAPMIVTNWINLQYYASAVDNRAFGSGNKVIHNVVSQMGVLLGNGGDLMTGLPWQSVHDGTRFQHEPLRLLVVIEAPRDAVQRIIDKHQLVCDLSSNGWLSLVALDDEQVYRWTSTGRWQAENLATQTQPAGAAVRSIGSVNQNVQGGY
jgi:uncharacterized protein YbcC (UPF0753/DUF2309 family)